VAAYVNGTLTGHEMTDFIHNFLRPQISQAVGSSLRIHKGFILAKDVAGLR
jgi:hypothetical protein